jgi:hypothetical protein
MAFMREVLQQLKRESAKELVWFITFFRLQ